MDYTFSLTITSMTSITSIQCDSLLQHMLVNQEQEHCHVQTSTESFYCDCSRCDFLQNILKKLIIKNVKNKLLSTLYVSHVSKFSSCQINKLTVKRLCYSTHSIHPSKKKPRQFMHLTLTKERCFTLFTLPIIKEE